MSFDIHIESNQEEVTQTFRRTAVSFLHEAAGELAAQGRNNQRVRTGRTRRSWKHSVDEQELVGYIGSDAENAVYEEFGTGEYALNGNGRKGGWWYFDVEKNRMRFTRGKKPHRPLYRAYIMLKEPIIAWAKERFGNIV